MLLRAAEESIGILSHVEGGIVDKLQSSKLIHNASSMMYQRVMAIAAGYEDLNDADTLRHDPWYQSSANTDAQMATIASFLCMFSAVSTYSAPTFGKPIKMPQCIQQPSSNCLFNVYVKNGRTCACIIFRADSGFCRERTLSWYDRNDVDYVVRLAKNLALCREAALYMEWAEAKALHNKTKERVYGGVIYGAATWSCKRHVIVKAEHGPQGSNPRCIRLKDRIIKLILAAFDNAS